MQGQVSQPAQFFVEGIFSTFNQGRLTKKTQQPLRSAKSKKNIYKCRSSAYGAAPDAKNAELFPVLELVGSTQRVLRKATEKGTIHLLGGLGEALPPRLRPLPELSTAPALQAHTRPNRSTDRSAPAPQGKRLLNGRKGTGGHRASYSSAAREGAEE